MLQYYIKENIDFSEAKEKKIISQEAKIIKDKICRHFKLRDVGLNFTSGGRLSRGGRWQITINYDMLNFLIVCHELGHTYQLQKLNFQKGDRWHGKEHHKIMKRMINYCKKKNWFSEELKRRTTPKPIKEITPQEQSQKDIIKAQEKIIKYEKKVLFYQRKLSKAKRSFKMKMSWLQKRGIENITPELENNATGLKMANSKQNYL